MYRTHHCGELRTSNISQTVKLSGWVQKFRDKGFVAWVDLRDRLQKYWFEGKVKKGDVVEG